MALYPAPDMTSGAVSIWVAGDEQAERGAGLVRELGHGVTRARRRVAQRDGELATSTPSAPLRGVLRPPADKSISHRAALIAAMGEGETAIVGYLDAADTRSTLAAVSARSAPRSTGASAGRGSEPTLRIARGRPARRAPRRAIDVGNAGTLLRLLPGWLAGQPAGAWTLDGDESIRRRPVDRIVEPLRPMGASLRCREDRLPPLEIEGAPLHGITYELPLASAQVKSCLLFAGLLAEGETPLIEPLPHPRPHRAHARRRRRRDRAPRRGRRRPAGGPARAGRDRRPGRLLLGRLLPARRDAGSRQRSAP